MEYRRIGQSGLQISALSLGTWLTFGKGISDLVAQQLIHTAYDAGINFFDNAEKYADGNAEIIMGRIFKRMGADRSSYLISTKLFFGVGNSIRPNQSGLSRKHIFEGCHGSLKRLQQDYIDILFCHRSDRSTPIEETVWAMHSLIMQGKILYWGTSEWDASDILQAIQIAEKHHLIGPTLEQPQYNILCRSKMENDYLDLFQDHGLGATTWSPLAGGLLTGKYFKGVPKNSRADLEGVGILQRHLKGNFNFDLYLKLSAQANELGISLPQFMIAWCLKNKFVSSVILGASNVDQLKENLKSLTIVEAINDRIYNYINDVLSK